MNQSSFLFLITILCSFTFENVEAAKGGAVRRGLLASTTKKSSSIKREDPLDEASRRAVSGLSPYEKAERLNRAGVKLPRLKQIVEAREPYEVPDYSDPRGNRVTAREIEGFKNAVLAKNLKGSGDRAVIEEIKGDVKLHQQFWGGSPSRDNDNLQKTVDGLDRYQRSSILNSINYEDPNGIYGQDGFSTDQHGNRFSPRELQDRAIKSHLENQQPQDWKSICQTQLGGLSPIQSELGKPWSTD